MGDCNYTPVDEYSVDASRGERPMSCPNFPSGRMGADESGWLNSERPLAKDPPLDVRLSGPHHLLTGTLLSV